ncbi:uncharacterized protein LOC135697910 [Ochlerotatus camptorhynchus]|uniref:uncharacterized protein LOC135697910 n=1 Tax=Ochlerotatus camptorhynchus TaxID=644619 RepID=UPI0031D41B6A
MCWLQSDHHQYSQFVAFRVGEILEETDVTECRWIGTKVNVADDGTKWKYKPDLKPASRWFNGPSFLWRPKIEWPESSLNGQETAEEIRSSNVGSLTQQELLKAEVFEIKRAQEEVYVDELAILAVGARLLQKKNSLFKVSPFLDKRGVMRIHSRLGECVFVDESNRYPIVLPREHPVTVLLIRDVHLRYHHHHETCVNEVRKGFHIPRVRRVYDRVRREYQLCKVIRIAPAPPMMAPLPKARMAAFVRPFSYVGVDFFGPFFVVVGRHHEKRWGVIITCLTVRAIHLELAASLNTTELFCSTGNSSRNQKRS